MRPKPWAGAIALGLIAVGLGVSLYLFDRGNNLAKGAAGSDFCNAVFEQSCDATLTSEYGNVLGLSVAGWGVVYFAAMAALLAAGVALRSVFMPSAISAALLANLAGLGISGYLLFLLFSGAVPVCPLCLVTHGINVLLFGALVLYRGDSPTAFIKDTGAALNYLFAPGKAATSEQLTRGTALVAVALFAAVVFEGLVLRSQPSAAAPALSAPAPAGTSAQSAAEQMVRNVIQAYLDQDVVEIPVSVDDPRFGPPDAPVQLVVFSDFECPSCKANARNLDRLKEMYGDRISIVAKNYPLSSACNPAIATNPHKFACGAAYASVAAHMQGKFWPFHHLIYGLRGAPTPEALAQAARDAGLDLARFVADMNSDAAKAKVKQDIDLGIQLKVIQTPTMFLNGRLLNGETSPHIPLIIGSILNSSAASGTNQ